LRCGACARAIPSPESSGGDCQDPTCDELICATCWGRGLRHCRTHQPSAEERLAQAQAALQRGEIERLITAAQARQREQAFIARFEERVYGIAALRHPLSGELLSVERWQDFHTVSDDSDRLLELLGVAYLERSLLAVTPINVRSRFAIERGALGRGRPRQGLILEAHCLSDLEAHVQHGLVTGPAPLSWLMTHLQARQEEAERTDAALVLALASTGGWDQASLDYVGADASGRGYRHRLLLPVVVDLHTAQLHYNATDERLQGLIGLFRLTTEAEEVLRVRQWIEATLQAEHRSGLTLREVTDALAVSPALVQQTFQQMAQDQHYRFVPDHETGGVLMSKT
jgi:hypothetical protein